MSNEHVHPIFRPILAAIAEPRMCEVCGVRESCSNCALCPGCRDSAAEAAWKRQQEDGESFRGNEYVRWLSEQLATAQRLK